MSSNAYKDGAVNDLSAMLKVLSEPNRLKILFSMGLECAPVSAIIARTGLSQTNVSFHLRILREAGLVKGERNGPFIYYCLYDTKLLELLSGMTKWREDVMQRIQAGQEEEGTPQVSSTVKN